MSTITLWLLLVVNTGGAGSGNVSVLERFATPEECMRVQGLIPAYSAQFRGFNTRCVQATVVRERPAP